MVQWCVIRAAGLIYLIFITNTTHFWRWSFTSDTRPHGNTVFFVNNMHVSQDVHSVLFEERWRLELCIANTLLVGLWWLWWSGLMLFIVCVFYARVVCSVCGAARDTDEWLFAEGLVSRPALPLLEDRRESDEQQHKLSLIMAWSLWLSASHLHYSLCFTEGVVHLKMKSLSFTHPNLNEFLSSAEHKRRYFDVCKQTVAFSRSIRLP